jgi:hypothetical protein
MGLIYLFFTLSYYKANHTMYNVFVFVNDISCTSIKFSFKIITVAVELKSYSNIKGTNGIKSWMLLSYVETPLSNTNIKKLCLTALYRYCDPVNTTGMSHLKVLKEP